nr:bacillithiol biosynthesis cysteine-adding enzyme BshC [uncultured Capnocytophaga sp.]
MIDYIPFKETGYFSEFITDYLAQKPELRCLYHRFPVATNFPAQVKEKQASYSAENRNTLFEAITQQYKRLAVSRKTYHNIELLQQDNTFTITTGHQLSLFTGPLYFIYKIVTTILTCDQLQKLYPEYNFVPIYWMATEDHDFEEINHFSFQGQKISWHSDQKGMVGQFATEELNRIANLLKTLLGKSHQGQHLASLFERAYTQHTTLASATRYLVNELFTPYGLVIIDANDKHLKELFIPHFRRELLESAAHKEVEKTLAYIKSINKNYPEQVHPREINIFYVKDGIRERIVKDEQGYAVLNTPIRFTEEEILRHLECFPEYFSPNVILRPMYQEVILPNLAYIGGGGEIAYWLELKEMFALHKVPFPILMLRNSVLLISEAQEKKLHKLGLTHQDIFLKNSLLENKITQRLSEYPIDFSAQKACLQEHFTQLHQIATHTDKSFLGAVKAQEAKQLKGLEHLEKRLLKAQKKKYRETLDRVLALRVSLFPKESLQERVDNFSAYMIESQGQLIDILIKELSPFDFRFVILSYESKANEEDCIEYFI